MVWCRTILGTVRPQESLSRFGGLSCGSVATGRRAVPNLTGARAPRKAACVWRACYRQPAHVFRKLAADCLLCLGWLARKLHQGLKRAQPLLGA